MSSSINQSKLRKKITNLIEYWDFSPQQDEDSRIERVEKQIISIIEAETSKYRNIVDNVLLVSRADIPSVWTDSESGKKLYNEAEKQQLLEELMTYIDNNAKSSDEVDDYLREFYLKHRTKTPEQTS